MSRRRPTLQVRASGVVICCAEMEERGEEVTSGNLGERGSVFVSVENDLTVQGTAFL